MENIIGSIEKAKFIIYIFAFILTIIEVIQIIRRVIHKRPTRHLRKVWGIKDKEDVILVCSELEDPEEQQIVKDKLEDEQGEFIYNRKYGDLDAYFEVVYTLLKLYPNLKLRILSCGEAAKIKLEYDKTLILIGGPDYNTTTREFLQYAKIYYRSPDCEEQSTEYPNQIVLFHKRTQKELCGNIARKDFGYFERIRNPHNPKKHLILIGGCHTIGVTGAIKSFSLVPNEQGEIKNYVLSNSKKVAKLISKRSDFAVIIQAEKTNQTIHTPDVKEEMIFTETKKNWYSFITSKFTKKK